MKEFPADIKFKYNWRSYQERVLAELEQHLDDDHLHIIAPPGSGKTILGLEVALRLGKPTLILTPTIAIRNQWIQRFCELFLQQDEVPDWISRSIKEPGFLTVSTYQGLHAACTGEIEAATDADEEDEEETEAQSTKVAELIKNLKKVKVGTIVVDEAHHLKNAWWKSLMQIKTALEPTIVGLTATPPYDVSFQEWQRYLTLNGPIDSEITVPELVVEGDLCPHQDFVYISAPEPIEQDKISTYKNKVHHVFDELKSDEIIINFFADKQYFKEPSKHLDWIYANIEEYSSILIYLNASGFTIPKVHLNIIGDNKSIVPEFTPDWAASILTHYLYYEVEEFEELTDHQNSWIKKLKHAGLSKKHTISFNTEENTRKYLSASLSKLKSIVSIVKHEYQDQGENLRQVVLTDYIRKEVLEAEEQNSDLIKIGVLPIFETIRRADLNIRTGILTGSLVVIHQDALPQFESIANRYKVDSVSTTTYPHDDNYRIISPSSSLKQDIVAITTELFETGGIQVLIGTKSLLGEGWDAPSINSLILASYVGSYVLSNQMRGRAIRAKKGDEDKTGNIWHLVCIDTNEKHGGGDLKLLERRFKAFVGVSLDEDPYIENGLYRLRIFDKKIRRHSIEHLNNLMLKKSSERALLKQRWDSALKSGRTLIEEMKIPFQKEHEEEDYMKTKSLHFNKTIAYLTAQLGTGISMYLFEAFEFLADNGVEDWHQVQNYMYSVGAVGIVIFGRQMLKSSRLYIKYRDISKDIQNIGNTVLASLIHEGSIKSTGAKVVCKVEISGDVYCHIQGGSTYEKSLFIQSLEEIISPIENPRYLIILKSKLALIVNQKDYHSVPEQLGRKKVYAKSFFTNWKIMVGSCELVYTRNIVGRKMLLKARMKSLSATFTNQVERVSKWR